VIPLLASEPVVNAGAKVGSWIGRIGMGVGSDVEELARGFASLNDVETRKAFVHTARSVIEIGGQRINAADKLYLAAAIPTLIVWGDRDPVIPARHGIRAHERMPGSRLVVFEGARHYPHHDEPIGFSAAVTDFIDTTPPSQPDEDALRRLLLERAAAG
jgi:pimeloyl-ACP methyl ester carboxylesterase